MTSLSNHIQKRLENQMRRGQLLLFSGAGFSLAARSRAGLPLPGVQTLKSELWKIGLPDEPYDKNAALPDVYHAANSRAGNRTRDLLYELLTVDPDTLPDWYRIWFTVPWRRAFTLNIDDLDEAVNRAFELPRVILPLSALTSHTPPQASQDLLSVHLNGMLREYPSLTFTSMDYARRAAGPDPWYQMLVAELSDSPVVFVGTELQEQDFWDHLQLRRIHGGRKPEHRPGSYLVTPSLSPARRTVLKDLNIDLIEMTAEEFAVDVLQHLSLASEEGRRVLSARAVDTREHDPNFLLDIAELRRSKGGQPGRYLLGREPTWQDVTSGYAVERDFESNLKEGVRPSKAIVLSGTAGSGKSTTMMRLALSLQAEALDVRWMNKETTLSLRAMRRQVSEGNPDVVCIDDVDMFGRAGPGLLVDLLNDNPGLRLLCTFRTGLFNQLDVDRDLSSSNVDYEVFHIPHLEDRDIDRLIEALTDAGLLGRLKGKTLAQQRAAFSERAGRQLLVAMMEATTGERFEEKIDEECAQLEQDLQSVYALCALVTARNYFLYRDEIILAAQEVAADPLGSLRRLVDGHLVVQVEGRFSVRHRVVAERVQRYFRSQGMLREPLIGLLWSLATKFTPALSRHSRQMRLLIDLMNHKTLANLADSAEAPRVMYERLQELLGESYHFWLQRGSYELDHGDLQLADNYLNQALQIEPREPLVLTAWAHKELRWAADNPAAGEAQARAEEALAELEVAIEQRGVRDRYPYHVIGSQGLHWCRRGALVEDERKGLLGRLLNLLEEGVAVHPGARDIRQLRDDVKREYLGLAVREDGGDAQET